MAQNVTTEKDTDINNLELISFQPNTFLNYRHDFAFKIFQKIFFLDYQKLFKNK